ncbi:MAG: SGNH/GDSL hydrolase family protein [Verrucomicrobiota bacterium]
MTSHLPLLMKQWREKRGQESFRVVAFGSSNTEIGWSCEGRHGWPCWLSCIFRASVGQHVQSMNAGIGGNSAVDLLKRVNRDVLPIQPHLVIITIGGNDFFQRHTLADFESNLRQLEAILRGAGAVVAFQTYYALLPEAGTGFDAYMDVVRKVATATNAGLIDQYSWFSAWQKEDLTTYRTILRDPAHLKPVGNALFGTLAGRVCGCWDPAVPADLPIYNHIPALERHGAPTRNIKLL